VEHLIQQVNQNVYAGSEHALAKHIMEIF